MIKFIIHAWRGDEIKQWTNWMIFAERTQMNDEFSQCSRLFLRLICAFYEILPVNQILTDNSERMHTCIESTFAQIFVIYKSGYDLLFLSDFLWYSIANISVKLWIASRCLDAIRSIRVIEDRSSGSGVYLSIMLLVWIIWLPVTIIICAHRRSDSH